MLFFLAIAYTILLLALCYLFFKKAIGLQNLISGKDLKEHLIDSL